MYTEHIYVSSQVICFIMGMDEHSKSASAVAIMRSIPDMSPEQDQLQSQAVRLVAKFGLIWYN